MMQSSKWLSLIWCGTFLCACGGATSSGVTGVGASGGVQGSGGTVLHTGGAVALGGTVSPAGGSAATGGAGANLGGVSSSGATSRGGTTMTTSGLGGLLQGGAPTSGRTAGGSTMSTGGTTSVMLGPGGTSQSGSGGCSAWEVEPEQVPSKLQLVVDVSSSMSQVAPGSTDTKWAVTRDALVEAICGVAGPGLFAGTSVGLFFYPNKINSAAVSATPVAQDVCLNTQAATPMRVLGDNSTGTQRTLLRTALTAAVLGSGTPTADAYEYALNHGALTVEQLANPGETYMLLITDGMPSHFFGCYNPAGVLSNLPGDEVVALVNGAYSQGVKTLVIGLPGSEEAVNWLSRAAYFGGTERIGCNPNGTVGPYCHMDMTTATDLSAALRDGLAQVVKELSQCRYLIPSTSADGTEVVDPNRVVPIIRYSNGTTELVGRSNGNNSTCTEGFRLRSATELELCDDTCSKLLGDTAATLQLIFGCTPAGLVGVL